MKNKIKKIALEVAEYLTYMVVVNVVMLSLFATSYWIADNYNAVAAFGWLSLGLTYIITSPPTFLVQFWAEKNPVFEESNEKNT
jgi:predicted signal transduction protein with EAL and GGDEF domain